MLRHSQSIRAGLAKLCLMGLVLLAGWLPRFAAAADPAQGPGGPILVVTSSTGTFSKYYAEILRTEGFNEFAMADVSTVTPALLANYDLVIVSKMVVPATQANTLATWVGGGGRLIVMAPDASLAGVLGVTPSGSALSSGYMLVDTSASPGNGIVGQTIQFHSPAALLNIGTAKSLGTLYSSAGTPTAFPAVTLNSSGSGQAAAFAFDLAESVVYTRQGNPAWASQERDAMPPRRSDDKFFGNASGDVQPDWVDPTKIAIPQADEQQRLLGNLILQMASKPLPRFWYLPNGKKAAVVMTGDDHGNGGTAGRFDQFIAASPAGCSVANWECVRGTSYIYSYTPITDAQAAQYNAQGFEISMHVNTNCEDYDTASLPNYYLSQSTDFKAAFPSLPAPVTERHHCIVWSDWTTGADVELSYGIRLDTSYYYWPPSWVNNVPGIFTGSVMPMRFAHLDGSFVDVYMAASQMTDESGQTYPFTVDTLLDRATGPLGYYGVYTINAHTDLVASQEASTTVASAQAHGVPVVTARQMLTWLDARNASSFGTFTWTGGKMGFTVTRDPNANGLQGMVPLRSSAGVLSALTRGGTAVAYTVSGIKGVEYALFSADAGSYLATYSADTLAPAVASTTPNAGATGVPVTAQLNAVFSEGMNASTITKSTVELRDAGNNLVSATVAYDAGTRSVTITPSAALNATTAYTVTLHGGASGAVIKDASGNALAANFTWSFTTGTPAPPPSCPCEVLGNGTPANPAANDSGSVELGVRFRSDMAGYISGVRFYKGATNTGTHSGELWTNAGVLLASATFTGETASGWQQVNFSSPIPIAANTTYVASYFAPNGNYAADPGYFANQVDNAPLHLLKDGADGPNGAFAYGSTPTYPNGAGAANYWVEPVFVLTSSDTTPPTVTAKTPAANATGVSIGSTITATFSEALNASTVSTSTVIVKTAANATVAGSVAYNASTSTITFTPSSSLPASTQINVTLVGGSASPRLTDLAGNALAANVAWSFTTGAAVACPCDLFGNKVPNLPAANDPTPVELGVKFTSDTPGYISGIKFYKGTTNTGTHTGSLWSSTGTLLARAVFSGETAGGWQQVNFSNPVAISANVQYVASYFTTSGNYAADANYFASGVDVSPLHVPSNAASGGNGVYGYGSAPNFPTGSFNATNYWVEPVYVAAFTDSTPPTVASKTPAAGATGVNVGSGISATFSEAIDASTLNSSTVTVKTSANATITGTISYDAPSTTMTFTPSALMPASTAITVTLAGGASGVKDLAGNAMAANFAWTFTTGTVSAQCQAPANPIVAENCLAGSPSSQWDVVGAGDASILGFATQISVNRGSAISFKVKTDASNYRFDIYRMGYYGGMGARKITSFAPSAALPQLQDDCLSDAGTGLLDCGNWGVSATWTVPATATSGIYFAKLTRTDTGGSSHIFFVVRDDASRSALLFQTSDTTWQAYNEYGGNSLYVGAPVGRAYKVSYNRPFTTRSVAGGQDWVFNAEYPMVRFLESNGYDMTYFSGVDADRSGALIKNHKTFLSVGHDEYWSGAQRSNVEAARTAGVNLAFFSGNEVFWKTRWESSIDGSNTAYRTLVTYKETTANAKIDPTSTWTGTWRDPRFSPPADGGRPENALTGTLFMNNDTGVPYSITVPAEDGKMRFWRNTTVATQTAGATATLPLGTLGYEWDIDADNGARPAGTFRLSTTKITSNGVLQDWGTNYGAGTLTHSMTMYKSGTARVFGAGTIQWTWGLDANHDRGNLPADVRIQQATVNVLADLGNVQPATLQAGLVAATQTTDATAPTSKITSPVAFATVTAGTAVTISGTATDTGGGVVGGVEVSTDGGTTWHPATTGRASWTYAWTPSTTGFVTLRSRAADDSGNLESPGSGVTVFVQTRSCPCSIWPASAAPANGADPENLAVNLGMKFKSDSAGKITGVRFYKSSTNTGTHVGTLWSSTGTKLGQVTFTGETASGWQQANFATPIAISANTTYVVSYLAPKGHYAGDNGGLSSQVDSAPLHALADGASGGNGVYAYGSTSVFPTATYGATNYWVDVVFTP